MQSDCVTKDVVLCSLSIVLCSLEISKPVVVEKEGKRVLAHPAPTALAQDEPPWLALAKKKAKAWSEMPQIVQWRWAKPSVRCWIRMHLHTQSINFVFYFFCCSNTFKLLIGQILKPSNHTLQWKVWVGNWAKWVKVLNYWLIRHTIGFSWHDMSLSKTDQWLN